MRRGRITLLAAVAVVLTVPAPALGAPKRGPEVQADFFYQRTPALRAGQIELLTVSTLPDAVTGGDVLMAVRGLDPSDRLVVRRNRRDVTAAFAGEQGAVRKGIVEGLRVGMNRITAIARGPRGRRVASLLVRNHPVTGPVISGPHQEPFYCETVQSGLGEPLDEDCSIRPRVQWFYRSTLDGGYHELSDPRDYPGDVARTRLRSGRTVPFVVRVETRTINRGITRMAVLDDPRSSGPDAPVRNNWNRRVTYLFGESCGVGYHQGRSNPSIVLGPTLSNFQADVAFAVVAGLERRIGTGDVVVHSTQSAFGVYCNPLVSAETLAMVKEHLVETYGEIDQMLGLGGSGGALQQYNALNNAPGLLDGGLPIATFTDVLSTAMTVVDCGLLLHYWESPGVEWSDEEKLAVSGHARMGICEEWQDFFLDNLNPARGCSGIVPDEVRYHPERNPKGVRCTLQDATVNIWGRDPATGFARRPVDNSGVQYGLAALNSGVISFEQFLDMNRRIGGFDDNGGYSGERMEMDPEVARRAYRLGGIVGRGGLDQAPIIDLATYLDTLPVLGFHDHVRPFMAKARLQRRPSRGGTLSLWKGVTLPGDAFGPIDRWIENARDRGAHGDPGAVAAARPGSASDRCAVGFGTSADVTGSVDAPFGVRLPVAPDLSRDALLSLPVKLEFPPTLQIASEDVCERVFPVRSEPRLVAGGPFTDDVIKCSRKAVDRRDYSVPLSDARLAELRQVFPGGVCDWSQPGVGEADRSMLYPSLGADRLRRRPVALRWRAARSAVPRARSRR